MNKARNHIIRATLDLHKLIFAILKENLDKFVLDERLRLGFNKPESDVLREFSEFIQKGREARKIEVNSIGNNPLDAILHYEDANHLGFTLYQALDLFKSTKVNYFLKKFASKEILIAFLVGILSSYAAGEISKILSPTNQQPAPSNSVATPHVKP